MMVCKHYCATVVIAQFGLPARKLNSIAAHLPAPLFARGAGRG